MRVDRVTVIACALFLVGCAAGYGGLFSHAFPGDTTSYATYGRALALDARIPYRDFYDEYPPGSVPLFALPAVVANAHYLIVFKLLMTACGLGAVVCAAWLVRRLGLSRWRLAPAVLAPPILGPVFLNRYDPLAALIGMVALVALIRGRDRAVGALLGVGTALKVFPAVWLLVAVQRVRSWRSAGVAFAVACGALVLPFFALAPGGVGFSLWTQLRRHLQIESVGSSLLLVASKLGLYHVQWIAGDPGSIDLGGRVADAVGLACSLLAIALVVLVALAYRRGPDSEVRLVTAWAATLAAFTVFAKVLSPQYLVWLVPIVPLAAGRKGAAAAVAFFAALSLTQLEYLAGDHGLRNQNWTVWLLLARNGLLVVCFALLYAELRALATRR
ncbi:MAG: glycosyltransferase family 87 protein [Actinomycetes bacterium]